MAAAEGVGSGSPSSRYDSAISSKALALIARGPARSKPWLTLPENPAPLRRPFDLRFAADGTQLGTPCQPLFVRSLSCATMWSCWLPTKVAATLSHRLRFRVWPDPEAELPFPFAVQWLFSSVPVDPGASGPSPSRAGVAHQLGAVRALGVEHQNPYCNESGLSARRAANDFTSTSLDDCRNPPQYDVGDAVCQSG